jgi:beta-glucosidase
VETNGAVTLTIPVSNTGRRDGTEIVQVYLRRADDANGPLKTLREFKRVPVAAGKTAVATITLPYTAFEFYDEQKLQMRVIPGKYTVWYGNSSADENLKMTELTVR